MINRGFFVVAVAVAALSAGCEKNYSDPPGFVPREIDGKDTISIAKLKAMYPGVGTPLSFVDDKYDSVYIKGKVVSSDESGNIFSTIYIQDDVPGAASAISVRVGRSSLFNFYPPGMMLAVRLKNLTLGGYGRFLSLGSDPYTSFSNGRERFNENGYIAPDLLIDQTLVRGPLKAFTDADTTVITTKAAMTGNPGYLGRLVRIRGTFSMNPERKTWAFPGDPTDPNNSDSEYGEHYIRFAGSTANDVTIRTSPYSVFANQTVDAFDGETVDVTGILTIYNTTYQLMLNTNADVVIVK